MEAYQFCQSCGMPLDRPSELGTEKDHSKSTIYCIHCYQEGRFTDEEMTFPAMQTKVTNQLAAMHADERTIREALDRLPNLSRWLGIPAIHHDYQWH